MGVAEWFGTFCANLRVQKEDDISYRYRAITKRLNSDFWDTQSDTAHSLYVGSYGRNTAIDFSDIDIIMELPSALYFQYDGYATNGQSALLQFVKRSIERTYSKTSLKADGQVIQVPFTDGINFEVVPVFTNKAGSYTFPNANSGGSWRTTNPRPEIAAIRNRNAACNNNLIPLCRMMRAWKDKWSVPMGGLLIDTLAYQFIKDYAYRDKSYLYYDFMCRDFFDWMAGQDANQEYWKAPGSGQSVNGKGLFQYKARRCCNIAISAITYAGKNQEWAAKHDWRDILEPHSQTDDTPQSRGILEGQLREAFGRVVYSHKTHEKCADILLDRLTKIRVWQIILSAATTAGLVVGVVGKNEIGTTVSLVVSTVLLALNAYTKDNDDGARAQKHRKTGSDLWLIRERFCSLLVDVAMREKPLETLQQQRDQLIEHLGTVYAAAPSTNSKAYMQAQGALQKNEDMTFSDEEIDAFLPKELKRGRLMDD